MFFIGGFNSIFPYLLYLSLIWAFMIIGLSGRINVRLSSRPYQLEKNILLVDNSESHVSVNNISTSYDFDSYSTGNLLPVKPINDVFSIIVTDFSPFQSHLCSVTLRGPPVYLL